MLLPIAFRATGPPSCAAAAAAAAAERASISPAVAMPNARSIDTASSGDNHPPPGLSREERLGDCACGGQRRRPRGAGHRSNRPALPARMLGDASERSHRALGKRVAGDRTVRLRCSAAGIVVAEMHEDDRPRHRHRSRPRHLATTSGSAVATGARITTAPSMDGDCSAARRAFSKRAGVAPAPRSTGLLTPAFGPAIARIAAWVAPSNSGTLRPAASHASAASTAAPPALPMMARRCPSSARLIREQLAAVEQLLERVDADDTGLTEQGVDDGVGTRQRGGVRGGGARPGRAPARLDDHDGRGAGHDRRDPRERAGVAERFEVQEDRPRLTVLVPVPEQIVAADVALVAHADEAREPQPRRDRLFEEGDAERSRLRSERDPAVARCARGEGGVQRDLRAPC